MWSTSSRAQVRATEPLWIPKFVLRILTFVLAIVGVGLLATDLQLSINYFTVDGNGSFLVATLVPWPMIPLSASVLWNLANIIVRMSRARPMHPGANVAMDLIIWLGAAVTGALLLVDAIVNLGVGTTTNFDYNNDFTNELITVGNIETGSVGVILAIMVLHFILFVWACRDTHVRNRAQAAQMATYMVADMQRQGGGYGPSGPYNNNIVGPSVPLFTADGRQVSGFYPTPTGGTHAPFPQQQYPLQPQTHQEMQGHQEAPPHQEMMSHEQSISSISRTQSPLSHHPAETPGQGTFAYPDKNGAYAAPDYEHLGVSA